MRSSIWGAAGVTQASRPPPAGRPPCRAEPGSSARRRRGPKRCQVDPPVTEAPRSRPTDQVRRVGRQVAGSLASRNVCVEAARAVTQMSSPASDDRAKTMRKQSVAKNIQFDLPTPIPKIRADIWGLDPSDIMGRATSSRGDSHASDKHQAGGSRAVRRVDERVRCNEAGYSTGEADGPAGRKRCCSRKAGG